MPTLRVIKIGDTVSWRGGWGRDLAKDAVVEGIEVNCDNKAGTPVDEITEDQLHARTIFTLTNGHWAYGYQIDVK
jgi:hypothetical protein